MKLTRSRNAARRYGGGSTIRIVGGMEGKGRKGERRRERDRKIEKKTKTRCEKNSSSNVKTNKQANSDVSSKKYIPSQMTKLKT